MKLKRINCDLKHCPILNGIFFMADKMSGYTKEELHKKLLKLYRRGGGG